MRYNLFIGRYQSPHKGHMHIFNTCLEQGKPVLIAIRDIAPDDQNPLTAEEVKCLWEEVYKDNEKVKVIIIPDIASVNYGRGVGYDINQIDVPGAVSAISATEIRKQVMDGQVQWKEFVDDRIHGMLAALLRSK